MVLAFAGRRAQSIRGDLEVVSLRIRRVLTALNPSAVVGAMSDGADLMVIEAALGMQSPAVHVVLPTPREIFCLQSVEAGWRDRFERALDQVSRRGTIRSLGLPDGSDAYRQANVAFLDLAVELSGDAERAVVLAIAAEGEGQMVEDLLAAAELRTIPFVRIDPDVSIAERPRVFIAMPYGERKLDPQRKIEVNCDMVYQKVLMPALEHAQLYYRRADEEIDSGVVLEPMIEWLAEADLVIGDLQTASFNVGWGLGLRHLTRARQTLLICPAGTSAPFDLNLVRHVVYRQDENGLSDDAVVAAWAALAPYLRSVGDDAGPSDSPVDAVMDVAQWGVIRRRVARSARLDETRQQLALARDLADGDLMLEVLERADGLSEDELHLLRAEAGVGLVRLGRYQESRRLLRRVVDTDRDVLRPDAHVYYAQALYRPPDATVEAYDEAERTLKRILVKRTTHPEVHAMLGAVAKRRVRLRHTAEEREPDLRLAMNSYLYDYQRNLNAHYEGINVVAIGVVLTLRYGDEAARRLVRELLPAVRVAASLARRRTPADYWVAATLAECALHESLIGLAAPHFADAYREAGSLRPPRGDLDSTLFQLEFLRLLGVSDEPLDTARAALLAGAAVAD
jgi:tetratricopeptide (TPR) repeat protein